MRCIEKGVMSATTQVKVLSPEIILIALGQGFHVLEASKTNGLYWNLGEPKRSEWKLPRSRRSDEAVWRFGSRTDS